MRFITVQNEINNKDCYHMFPYIQNLSFRAMWAIPVTTYTETLTSLLMQFPNGPKKVFVFETDAFVRIDLIEYCSLLQKGDLYFPRAKDGLVDALEFYVVDIQKIESVRCIGNVMACSQVFKGDTDVGKMFMRKTEKISTLTQKACENVIRSFPIMMFGEMYKEMKQQGNLSSGFAIFPQTTWALYKYTVLPVLVYQLCEPQKDVIKYISMESCVYLALHFLKCEQALFQWFHSEQKREDYLQIYFKIKELIIDDGRILEYLHDRRLMGKKISFYSKCPCLSGKRFGQCCGKKIKEEITLKKQIIPT